MFGEIPPHFIPNGMKDNMFLLMLMRFHLEKETQAVRPVLLTTVSAARLLSTDRSPTGKAVNGLSKSVCLLRDLSRITRQYFIA